MICGTYFYSFFQEGERGILEGLASRYADQFNTHFQDVLEHLEYLRCQEWNKLNATSKVRCLPSPHDNLYLQKVELSEQHRIGPWSPQSSSSSSLDHNDDYPIYVPGKYNVRIDFMFNNSLVISN